MKRNWNELGVAVGRNARLCRVLRKDTPRQVGPLKTATGEWAEEAPTVLEGLLAAHFPDAQVKAPRFSPVPNASGCAWATAKKIVTLERLRWAISTFEPYKAPGSDEIYPVLLQKGMRVLALPLCNLLREPDKPELCLYPRPGDLF